MIVERYARRNTSQMSQMLRHIVDVCFVCDSFLGVNRKKEKTENVLPTGNQNVIKPASRLEMRRSFASYYYNEKTLAHAYLGYRPVPQTKTILKNTCSQNVFVVRQPIILHMIE